MACAAEEQAVEGLTHSCYDPDAAGRRCGQRDSCLLRRKGFEEAGIADR
jgi:7-cyano-7-deazaguanine synthase